MYTIIESQATGFQEFTGGHYVMIDIANQFGLDKETFETRIQWTKDNESQLEQLVDKADNPALFLKGVYALKDARAGIASGHMIGFDACASGPQIMSCLTGCIVGAEATGLIDPKIRKDLYGLTLDATQHAMELKKLVLDTSLYSRREIKYCNMPYFYGSDAMPKKVFGENTEEHDAFLDGMYAVTPGAFTLRNTLLQCWQRNALVHEWVLDDGFEVYVPNIVERKLEIEVDELNHAQFSHIVKENMGEAYGKSIAANVIHSIDGFIVREMNRRCNYDHRATELRVGALADEIMKRNLSYTEGKVTGVQHELFLGTNIAMYSTVEELSDEMLMRCMYRMTKMLSHKSFPIICVHDEFKCHPNNMNQLRRWYIEILAELAESNLLERILNQVTRNPAGKFEKASKDLPELIRANANYPLS